MISRRGLFQAGARVGGGLMVSMWLPELAFAEEKAPVKPFRPNAWIAIWPDDRVQFVLDKMEMGQGVVTSFPMMVAEELALKTEQIEVLFAPADRTYDNPKLGFQITGGSTSVKSSWVPLRTAAASAMQMLKQAAADGWAVPVDKITVADGVISHPESGRSARYGEVATKASGVAVPEVELKTRGFKVIGKAQARTDAKLKACGQAIYGIDVNVPGMANAIVLKCPVFEGKLKSFDAAAAKALPGVVDVFSIDDRVFVVAEKYWQAREAAKVVKIDWDEGAHANVDSAALFQKFRDRAKAESGTRVRDDGDANKVLSKALGVIEAEYECPYQAHLAMEVVNATAHVKKDSVEIWAGMQGPAEARDIAKRLTGLSHDQIVVHPVWLGGGFGRRLHNHYVEEAIVASQKLNRPVKVIWSREQDVQQDRYRPMVFNKLRAALDADGKPKAWHHQTVSQSIIGYVGREWVPQMLPYGIAQSVREWTGGLAKSLMGGGTVVDPTAVEGAHDLPYEIDNLAVDYVPVHTHVPVGFWRSVGNSHHGFVTEGFIDELAVAAKQDPYEYRRSLLKHHHRHRWVLDKVAKESGWGSPAPEGQFRGIAVHKSFDSFAAAVAFVSVENKEIKVHRLVMAIDCGQVVNPDGVAQQMESAAIFGLSAALKQEITIEKGRVAQNNMYDYDPIRMFEAPKIDVHLVTNEAPPTGCGEPGVPVIAPAVANAVFAATGQRLRRLPLKLA